MRTNAGDLPASDVPFLVYVEGNIAAGKSELLAWYNIREGIHVMKEPINIWLDFNEYNVLGLKYADRTGRKGHEMTFQVLANLTRLEQLQMSYKRKEVRMIERSLKSGIEVFAGRARRTGTLSNLNFEVLRYFGKVTSSGLLSEVVLPDLVVYLDVSPEICLERIRGRGRPEEMSLSLQDLNELRLAHELWLESSDVKCQVLRIKNEGEVGSIVNHMKEITEKIIELRNRKGKSLAEKEKEKRKKEAAESAEKVE